MTNLAKLTKAQLITQIEDLRTKYSDLSIGYDQLLHDISVLEMEVKDAEASRQADISIASHQQELDRAADEADDEGDEGEYVDRRSIPVASRQELASQRWEAMQKAKALAMSSGRSVKC